MSGWVYVWWPKRWPSQTVRRAMWHVHYRRHRAWRSILRDIGEFSATDGAETAAGGTFPLRQGLGGGGVSV